MTNAEYQQAKQELTNNRPVSAETIRKLQTLNKQYATRIKTCMANQDSAQAMFFKEDQFEIIGLIKKANQLLSNNA